MTSPPGAEDDVLGALNDHERAGLAAWADDGDVPDGFEDRVVAAFVAERLGEAGEPAGSGAEASERGVAEAAATTARTVGQGRVVRLVGLCAAVAAAAAVMLMVRVPPRASEMEPAREVAAVEPTALVEPAQPEPVVPDAEPSCETSDELATEATLIAARYCSPCHDSADRDAHPGALGVFDLQQQEWWSVMSDAQLEGARKRAQMLVEGSDATEDEERKLDAFLARRLELAPHAG